jgi:hypothetical protein
VSRHVHAVVVAWLLLTRMITEKAMVARHAIEDPTFVPLGIVVSTAPREALLAALQKQCPHWNIQLVPIDVARKSSPQFRVELKRDMDVLSGSIDPWLHIKGALTSSFPADKPHAVTTIDP